MKIENVKKWATFPAGGGTSHIVTSHEPDGCTVTACGTMTNRATVSDQRPKRICRKCREAVGYMRPAVEGIPR